MFIKHHRLANSQKSGDYRLNIIESITRSSNGLWDCDYYSLNSPISLTTIQWIAIRQAVSYNQKREREKEFASRRLNSNRREGNLLIIKKCLIFFAKWTPNDWKATSLPSFAANSVCSKHCVSCVRVLQEQQTSLNKFRWINFTSNNKAAKIDCRVFYRWCVCWQHQGTHKHRQGQALNTGVKSFSSTLLRPLKVKTFRSWVKSFPFLEANIDGAVCNEYYAMNFYAMNTMHKLCST